MRCLRIEFYRTFGNKKIWLITALMLVLNVALMIISCATDKISPQGYRDLAEELKTDPAKIEDVYSDDQDDPVNNRICDEYTAVLTHGEYVESVLEKADSNASISIFQNDFSRNNSRKTRSDYSALENIDVPVVYGYGAEKAVSFMGSSVIIIFVILILINNIVIQDKKNGVMELVRATRYGGARDAMYKTLAVMAYVVMVSFLVEISDVIIGEWLYGWVEMSAPVQSLYAFNHTGSVMTVGSFLVVTALYKALIYMLIAVFVMLFAFLSGNEIALYLMTFVFAAVELAKVVYGGLSGNNSILIRTGIFYGLDIEKSFQYYNYDIWGYPIQMQLANVVMYVIVICVIMCVYAIAAQRIHVGYRESSRGGIRRAYKGKCRGLFRLESYKFFIGYRGLVILLAFVSLQCYIYLTRSSSWNTDAIYYRYYMKAIEGEVTQDKIDYIDSEVARMEQLRAELDGLDDRRYRGELTDGEYDLRNEEIAKELRAENSIYKCKNYVDYVSAREENNVGFLYDRGWNIVLGLNDDQSDAKNMVLTLIMIILSVSFVFGEDYQMGMNVMIDASAGKMRSVAAKIVISVVVILASFVIVYLPELLWVKAEYGLTGGSFSLHSVQGLAEVDKYMSLYGYTVFIYVIRFLALTAVGGITALAARMVKNTNVSIIIAAIVYIAPLLLGLLGIHVLDNFTVTNIINVAAGR